MHIKLHNISNDDDDYYFNNSTKHHIECLDGCITGKIFFSVLFALLLCSICYAIYNSTKCCNFCNDVRSGCCFVGHSVKYLFVKLSMICCNRNDDEEELNNIIDQRTRTVLNNNFKLKDVITNKNIKIDTDEEKCSICLSNFIENNTKKNYELNCGHIFHQNCIRKWYSANGNCPICRKEYININN